MISQRRAIIAPGLHRDAEAGDMRAAAVHPFPGLRLCAQYFWDRSDAMPDSDRRVIIARAQEMFMCAEENATLESGKRIPFKLDIAMLADEHCTRPAPGARCETPDAHAVQVDLVLGVDAAEAQEIDLAEILVAVVIAT